DESDRLQKQEKEKLEQIETNISRRLDKADLGYQQLVSRVETLKYGQGAGTPPQPTREFRNSNYSPQRGRGAGRGNFRFPSRGQRFSPRGRGQTYPSGRGPPFRPRDSGIGASPPGPSRVVCWRCNEPGHISRECTKAPQPTISRSVTFSGAPTEACSLFDNGSQDFETDRGNGLFFDDMLDPESNFEFSELGDSLSDTRKKSYHINPIYISHRRPP
ncbi:MAG: hypothetical protein GY696_19545, partial [Gammaproteobacteria bacterium]|nr:hypothetical protein [Gammaproteobacteria bacterium]